MKKIISIVTFLSIFAIVFVGLSSLSPQKAQAQNVGSLKNIVTPGFSFTMDMALGDTDQDVVELQKVLNADVDTMVALDGPGSIGKETKYFGPATKVAVTKFQNKYKDVVLTLNGITTANGLVDKPTRTRLNLLLGVMTTNNSIGSPESRANTNTSSATVAYVAPAVVLPAYTNTGRSMTVCQFVELMIAIGVVPSSRATISRNALNCSSNNYNDDDYTPSTYPNVDLTVNNQSSVTVAKNTSVTLRWTTTHATACSATWGSSLGTSGSKVIVASASNTYSISCTGSGHTDSDTVSVSVSGNGLAAASSTASSSALWMAVRNSSIIKNVISLLTSSTTETAGPAPTSAEGQAFPSIATDSKNLPHILIKGEENAGLFAYNKISNAWVKSVPLIFKIGGPGNPHIEVDDLDNTWISGNTVDPYFTSGEAQEPSVATCNLALQNSGGAFGGTWSVFHDCAATNSSDTVAGGAAAGAASGAAIGATVGCIGTVLVGCAPGILPGAAVGAAIGGTIGAVSGLLSGETSNAGKIIAIKMTGPTGCEGITGLIGFTRGNIEQAIERGLVSPGASSGTILGQSDMGPLRCGVENTPQRQANVQALVDSGQYVILGKPIEGNWGTGSDSTEEEEQALADAKAEAEDAAKKRTGNWVGFLGSALKAPSRIASDDADSSSLSGPDYSSILGSAGGSSGSSSSWFKKVMDTTRLNFVGNVSVDPFNAGKAWFLGSQPDPIVEFTSGGDQELGDNFTPGQSGEKIAFKIAPSYSTTTATTTVVINGISTTTSTTTFVGEQGIWHAVSGGWDNDDSGYINSEMSNRVIWAKFSKYNSMNDDGSYVSVGIDWKNPKAAYIASSYSGVAINIWNGVKFLFPSTGLYVVDASASSFGNGIRRFAPQWTPAQGGGAFLCWTGGDGNVKLKYITTEGVSKFGPTTTIGTGTQCAVSTDTNGNIDLTYLSGKTVKYRKIMTATSTATTQ